MSDPKLVYRLATNSHEVIKSSEARNTWISEQTVIACNVGGNLYLRTPFDEIAGVATSGGAWPIYTSITRTLVGT